MKVIEMNLPWMKYLKKRSGNSNNRQTVEYGDDINFTKVKILDVYKVR
ncbi:hypothetical protein SAMN02746064_01646 [Alkalibacter saccharofermentans DSM 14828]|uniref:Uncharacterized protein n=1 Tax=Alkalibacter saccharofermentans DSM 14828 TaxID=1120975 RepID=A0A1M4Y084_9FIRM|nr:hypothetical protein SAMN02746064_01646 [Alkalibacter saccharofermentans DSM 14828]